MARNLSAHEKLSADTVLGRMIREMIAAGIRSVVLGSALVLVIPESAAAEQWCVVGDDGSGTASLPPVGCDYEGHHVIVEEGPPGTAIAGFTIHKDFTCGQQAGMCTIQLAPGECEADGGSLGGKVDCFGSMLQLHLLGYGDLFGFDRVLEMSIDTEVHTGPRSPGDPVQLFPAKIHMIQGEIVGDPDFTLLRIQGGPAFGLLSSGETLLTQLPDGNWNVESLFEFSYQIEYQGAPGGVFAGLAGTSTQVAKMRAGEPVWFGNPCEVPDNGTGTATLPPAGCDYLDAEDVHVIASGLPPGTTIELDAIHRNFTCGNPLLTCTAFLPGGVCEGPGGSLGGNIDCFQSDAELTIKGTGALAGFQRTITFPLDTEVHTGPRNPGDSIQSFPSEMFRLQGEIFGDPDFCTLRIRAGSQLGLPSPGHTTLTDNGNGTFAVASLFDVQYEIDFLGCPGSILEGFGGTASGTIRMFVGESLLPPLPPQMVPGPSATVWMWLGALTLGTTAIVLLRRRGQAL